MKKLLLLLILSVLSAQSLSKVGDTYWCSMTQFINLTVNEIEERPLESFHFFRDKEQIAFLSSSYLGGWTTDVTSQHQTDTQDIFSGGSAAGGFFKYHNGSFGFNYFGPTRAHTILAACSIN